MKKTLFLLTHLFCLAGFSENLPLERLGRPIQPLADLDIRWVAPTNAVAPALWAYRVLPANFSSTVISNLMAVGSFTDKDKTDYGTNGMVFNSPDGSRNLRISLGQGIIEYKDRTIANARNPKGVPTENKSIKLAKKFLPKLGISPSDLVKKKPNSSEFKNYLTYNAFTQYGAKPWVTKITFRGVYFIRLLDGVDFRGIGVCGGCRIDFGDHGKICRISLLWRNLERDKLYPTATPEVMMNWIRQGKCALAPMPDDWGTINWATVKRLTIHKITPYYFGEGNLFPQEWCHPFASLEATVDTGRTNLPVYINCPIIDESKSFTQ